MQNSIDVKKCLSIYDHITRKGQQKDGKYILDGVQVWNDMDGYYCYLAYAGVTMTIMFHGHYDIHFDQQEQLSKFEKMLKDFEL
jgi:hypothetical protein